MGTTGSVTPLYIIDGVAGEQLSMPEAEVKDWYDAVVPSTVMGVLTRNGVYSDVLER